MKAAARLGRALAVVGALLAGGAPSAHAANAAPLPSFQALVDATPDGGTLRPEPGTYAGPVEIRRALTIEGGGAVTIDAGGTGTVVRIAANGVTLRGLHLVGSGSNHDTVDAGVAVAGSGNVIEDDTIENCLFGVDLSQSNDNVVRHNRIHSKAHETALRGDAIRLWYSFRNQIVDNDISDTRDVVVWYSADNVISRNRVVRGRYALHTMYANRNVVEDNEFLENMTGIFLMYSDGVEIRRNRILGAQGSTGVGICFKESSITPVAQ